MVVGVVVGIIVIQCLQSMFNCRKSCNNGSATTKISIMYHSEYDVGDGEGDGNGNVIKPMTIKGTKKINTSHNLF